MNPNTTPGEDDDGIRRYAQLIERTLRASPPIFTPAAESCGTIQVERGVAYPLLLLDPSRAEVLPDLLEPWTDLPISPATVIDREGHRRPGYRGLLVHAAFRAIALAGPERTGSTAARWLALLKPQLASLRWPEHPDDNIPADRGAAVADAAWMALAAHTAAPISGDPSDTTLAKDAFARLVRAQHPSGTFLTPSRSDNPETHWYHELVLLHAATTYAAKTSNAPLATAVARNAEFHQAETQPDHATNQPWGLAAFACHPTTRPLADQLLHAAATLGASSGITSILLADALYSLRLLNSRDV